MTLQQMLAGVCDFNDIVARAQSSTPSRAHRLEERAQKKRAGGSAGHRHRDPQAGTTTRRACKVM